MQLIRALLFLLLFAIPNLSLSGAIVQVNGKWCDDKYAPTRSVSEHFDLGTQQVQEKRWEEALKNFLIITIHFQSSPFYKESLFYSGVCYYFLADFDLANKQFTKYLDVGTGLSHFEKVFEFKYYIAELFAKGTKKHLFGFAPLPKWMSAKNDALSLYDEVISSLPNKEIALLSLYGKAELLRANGEYRESIDTLMVLIRRFPKSTLAADSYLLISQIYIEQSELESQNPDLIGLAQVNLQRFRKSFPNDERVGLVAGNLLKMKEVYADALYKMAQFYERKKKPKASAIYYQEAVKRYPETEGAKKCLKKLASLNEKPLAPSS